MNRQKIVNKLVDEKSRIGLTGLGLTFILAGLTKFTFTNLWIGFEPSAVLNLLSVTSTQFTYAAGIGEALLGLWLVSNRKAAYSSGFAFLWLLGITVQVARVGAWTLFVRDVGLLFYALTVFLMVQGQKTRE